MNKIYKLVWSKVKNMWVVASELAKSHTKSPKSGIVGFASLASLESKINMDLSKGFVAGVFPMVNRPVAKLSDFKITVAAIVKNEAENVPTWVQAARSCADEIIVVDTGSTDGTVERFRDYGIECYHYEWNDDFALAKNYMISLCHGDWIVLLDGDEWFREGCDVRKAIAKHHGNPITKAIIADWICLDKDRNNVVMFSGGAVRAFRNQPDVRYFRKVHENLTINYENFAFEPDFKMYHTGYSGSVNRSKHERNLRIMRTMFDFDNGKVEYPTDWRYIEDTYAGLGEFEKALWAADKMISYGVQEYSAAAWITKFNVLFAMKTPLDEMRKQFDFCFSTVPSVSGFRFLAAIYYLRNAQIELGLDNYIEGLRMLMGPQDRVAQEHTYWRMYMPEASALASAVYLQNKQFEASLYACTVSEQYCGKTQWSDMAFADVRCVLNTEEVSFNITKRLLPVLNFSKKAVLSTALVSSLTVGMVNPVFAADTDGYAAGGGSVCTYAGRGVAIGNCSESTQVASIAIGNYARADEASSVAIGNMAVAYNSGDTCSQVAIGAGAYANGNGSIALGGSSVALCDNVVSFGHVADDPKGSSPSFTYDSDLYRRLINVADGINDHDVVTVGQLNTALANVGSPCLADGVVLGGCNNTATGSYASVAGGKGNDATGFASFAAGGCNADAKGYVSTAIGGCGGTAEGDYSLLLGGSTGHAYANYSTAIGGGITGVSGCSTTAKHSIAVGWGAKTTTDYQVTVGSCSAPVKIDGALTVDGSKTITDGTTTRTWSDFLLAGGGGACFANGMVLAGCNGTASGSYSSVAGGCNNRATGDYSTVSGGYNNGASQQFSSVSGGLNNAALCYASSVSGGCSNYASGCASSVAGGISNQAIGNYSFVAGGCCNIASGCCSTIVGGVYNDASGRESSVFGGSSNLAGAGYIFRDLQGRLQVLEPDDTRINKSVNPPTITIDDWNPETSGFQSMTYELKLFNGNRSTAVGGYDNSALGYLSTAIGGCTNSAVGDCSTVVGGERSIAYADYSTVIGGGITGNADCSTTALGSVAIGKNATTTRDYEVAIGSSCAPVKIDGALTVDGAKTVTDGTTTKTWSDLLNGSGGSSSGGSLPNTLALGTSGINAACASGTNALAIGEGALASGDKAISIGTGNQVRGDNSGAIGDPNIVDANNSYTVGNNSTISANIDGAFVLGNNVSVNNGTLPDNWNSLTDEEKSDLAGEGVIALGNNVSVSLCNKVNSSRSSNSTGSPKIQHVVAVGDSTIVGEENAIALGYQAEAKALNALAGGTCAKGLSEGATALGQGSIVHENSSFATAVGYEAEATGEGANAFGDNANAGDKFAMAFGRATNAQCEASTAIGNEAVTTGKRAVAIGNESVASAEGATSVGNSSNAVTRNAVSIGNQAVANGEGVGVVAIGNCAQVGTATSAKGSSTAVGAFANVQSTYSTALGAQTSVTANNSVALGAGSVASQANVVSVGAGTATDPYPATRKIINVTDGTANTDVSTVGQTGRNLALSGSTLSLKNANGTVLDSVTLPSAPTYTVGNGLELDTNNEFTVKAGTNVTVDSNGVNVSGNGTVASGNTGLISGGTLHSEVRPASDGNYITTTGTTGSNLTALDIQLKTTTDNLTMEITNRTNADSALSDRIGSVASDGNYIKASSTKNVAENLGLLDTQVKANVTAISNEVTNRTTAVSSEASARESADTALGTRIDGTIKDLSVNGQTITYTKGDGTTGTITTQDNNTQYTDGNGLILNGTVFSAKAGTNVTVDANGINVVGNGVVVSGNTGLVSGGTVFSETRVASNGNYIQATNSASQNLTALDTAVKANADAIAGITDSDTTYSAGNGLELNGTTFTVKAGNHVSVNEDGINVTVDGAVAENNTGIVSGGTVYTAVNSEKTARESADTTLQSNITNEKTARESADITLQTNIDNEVTARETAVSGEATARANVDTTLQGNIDTLSNIAVKYDSADTKDKVTLTGTNGTTIDNVKDATLSATSKEAVTGSQLFTTNTNIAEEITNRISADTELSNRIGTVSADGNYIKSSSTYDVAQNLGALDTAVKANADAIEANKIEFVGVNEKWEDWATNSTWIKKFYGVTNEAEYNALKSARLNSHGEGASGGQSVAIGRYASATYYQSTAVGDAAKATGSNASAFGENARAFGTFSTAIGSGSKSTDSMTVALGSGAEANGERSVALGGNTSVLGSNSVAIGYASKVKDGEDQVVSFGQDAYTIGTVTTPEATRRLIHVTAGINDTDAVNVKQLDDALYDKADWNAANIGRNLVLADDEYPDGMTAEQKAEHLAEVRQHNLQTWGEALGAGTVTGGDSRLVTGDTVHVEVRPAENGTYVKTNNTTGQNLLALDQQLSTVLEGNATQNTAISDLQNEMETKANVGLDNITDAGKTVVRDLAKESVKVVNGTNTTVTEGIDGNAKTYAVNAVTDGAVADGNTGIVTGGTVYSAIQDMIASSDTIDGKANVALDNVTEAGHTVIKTDAKSAVNVTGNSDVTVTKTDVDGVDTYNVAVVKTGTVTDGNEGVVTGGTVYDALTAETRPVADGNYIVADHTAGANLTALDTQVKANADAIAVNTTDITNLKDLSNITDAGQTVVKNLAKGSVNVVGANKASVTKTNVDGVDTYTVDVKADGVILADNKGLVDGGTVFDAVVAATGNIIDYTNDGLAGKANVELDNINPAGHTVIKTDAKSAINVIGGTNAEVVKTDVDGVDTYTVNVAGNGQVAENNTGLMNGGTVYAELRPTDGNYVRKDATTAANLLSLDTKIGTVANGDFVQSANTVGQNLNALDEALYDKANWDASNIGRNLPIAESDYPDGLTEEQKAEYASTQRDYNLRSWGQALGAGTVTGGDARLVTGDTLHVEVRPANSGTYVKVDKTTGENLLALDEQLSSVVNGASAQNTTINNLENEMANKANIALDNINADGQNVVRNIAKSAVVVADGPNTTVASSTDTDGNVTYRVTANATGSVTDGNTGLVDGGAVYTAIENAKAAMGGDIGGLDADGNYIRKANTVAENLVALDTQVKTNADGLVAEQTARETADTALGNRIGTLTTDGNYIAKDSSVSENLSSLDTALKLVRDKADSNTADITNLKDLSNITATGESVIKDLAKGSVKVINGTRTTVTEGTDGDMKTFAVNVDADGTVTDGNTGLVTGDAVYDALQNVQGSVTAAMADKANVSLDNLDADGINRVRDISKAAVSVANGTNTTVSSETDTDGNVIYKVNVAANGSVASGNAGIMSGGTMYDELRPADGNYVARSSTTAANLTVLDAAVKEAMTKAETAQAVTGGNVVVYDTDDRSSLTLGGADGTAIHNVADGAVTADSKDVVTGGQLYTVKSAVDENTTAIAGLDTRVQDNTTAIDMLRTTVTNGLDGKTDTDLGNLTDAGKDAVRDLAKESVRVADGVNTTVRTTVDGDASVYHVDVAANGRVESGNTGIVTGDAVYEAIRDIEINASDTHYVSINPSEKDDETFANHGASGADAVAIGAKSYVSGDESVAIGHNNDVSGNETYVIGSDVNATGNNSVVLGKGSDGSLDNVVSVGSAGNERRIVHVADGELSADSKDAVNGKQLYEVREKLQNAEGIDVDKWSDALGSGSVAPGDERLVKGSTVYSAIQSTGISLSPDGSTMNVGAANNATVVDFTNSEGNGRVLQGIVTDPGNPNSAANVGYVNAIGQNIVNGVNSGLNRLDTKINKVGAGAAALASLAPMPFDDDQKWSVSAAIGTYHGTQAGAVGVFYKPQDNVMLNIRGAIGNGENMGGAGLSIGLNKGAAKGLSKASMAKVMNAQANEIVAQKQLIENQQAQLDAQKAEIEELKQMVRSVVASKQVAK